MSATTPEGSAAGSQDKPPSTPGTPVSYADAVVVGAGPAGAATAAWLAEAGREVVAIDKAAFPREKVCGDGLTPRAVREIAALGLSREATGQADGWQVNRGLKIHGAETMVALPWPQLDDWPGHGLTCRRDLFDVTLVRAARRRGADIWEEVEVTGALTRDGPGRHEPAAQVPDARVSGVTWRDATGREGQVRAPVVVAADGASSRLATGLGLARRDDRPMGVAIRTYYKSSMSEDPWLSSFLDLEQDGDLLPGYGWLFPMPDGTVNLGCGLLNTSAHFGGVNYRGLLDRWAAAMPSAWHITEDTRTGSLRSAALPMGFARIPHHRQGLLLVGDAGGMINPFNGEGISYAMEAGRLAAEVIDRALARTSTAVLDGYADELRTRHGGYYTLGRWFVWLIGHPEVMRVGTTYGLPRRRMMEFLLKLMAQLTDRRPSDVADAVINGLQRAAPAA